MRHQPDGPGLFLAGAVVLGLLSAVKFSRLAAPIGLGSQGLPVGWLLIVLGVYMMLVVGIAVFAHMESGDYESIAERQDAERSAEAVASWQPDAEPPVEYCPPSNPDWFDEWWNELQNYHERQRMRPPKTWPTTPMHPRGKNDQTYGDLPGQPPRNPPPDGPGRPPRPAPVPLPPDEVEAWIDEQFDRVLYRNNKDG